MVEARHRHKLQHQSNGWVWAMSWSFNYGLSLIFCYSSGYVLNNSESNNEHYIENALFGKFISITINWLMSFFGKRLWTFVLTSKKNSVRLFWQLVANDDCQKLIPYSGARFANVFLLGIGKVFHLKNSYARQVQIVNK